MPAPPRSRRRSTRSPASTPPSRGTSTSPRTAGLLYRFIGGKGGVGKTTCAAGVATAGALAGHRTLVISTDPAPSLGDVFERALAGEPTAIPVRRGLLHAVEIDARTALARWIAIRRERLERIALRGTWLDEEDVARLLRLSLPGIDELAALFEITRLGNSADYDLIVVDTAPTGHTLRMLAMPDTLRAVARVFDEMQSRHRVIIDALRGEWTPDAEDALIEEIDRDARQLHALLRDASRVRVSWVTLPEAMAVEETADAAAALTAEGIPLADVIVNRITPKREGPCGWCDRRRAMEGRMIEALHRQLPSLALIGVAARASEPGGIRALAGIGGDILAAVPPTAANAPMPKGRWRAAGTGRLTADVISAVVRDGTRVVLFGGKGGVGKTTCAAAASIAMARHASPRRVLLVSTDPAHSLSDVFGARLSDTPAMVRGAPPNLLVREMDAAGAFRTVRAHYAQSIDALFERLSRGSGNVGIDAGHERRVMQGLIDLAPPGIDELAAVIGITDAVESDAGEVVVMDTAPSGHALRLLEMPALVQDWTKALMSLVLKYQPITGIGEFGAILLKLSQGLGRLRTLLTDADRACFIVVTRGASLPRAETTRLVARLTEMQIHVPAALVNAVGRGTCAACRSETKAEEREIVELRRQLPRGIQTVLAPSELPPPHGARALSAWYQQWRM